MNEIVKIFFFSFRMLFCPLFSLLVFLSFRYHLIYDLEIKILISFIIIQFIIWSPLFFKKKKYLIFFYNIFFIILLNFVLTPLFHLLTFDVPGRLPHYKIEKNYNSKFFEGMFYGKHVISSDYKGYRTNKKINYEKKNKNTLRIFTIGASTTEQGIIDDKKTWSSLLGKNLHTITDKNIEVINTGMAGLRAEHHYYTFKRIQKYKPDFVIFLLGINDWNRHIVKRDEKYLISNIEIKFNFKKSILSNFFGNINKQIKRKLFTKGNNTQTNLNKNVSAEVDPETFLLPQINSLHKRNVVKKFTPKTVSDDYKYWLNLIMHECQKRKFNCMFLDQATAYSKNITNKLKTRLWMTPPGQEYTLSLDDLIFVSSLYNSWLKNETERNNINFCLLSNKIYPNTKYLTDDCHFSENGSKKVSEVVTDCLRVNLGF